MESKGKVGGRVQGDVRYRGISRRTSQAQRVIRVKTG